MKKLNELRSNIENGKFTGGEIMLASLVMLLGGIIFGMLVSPRKNASYGCNCGNNNGNNNTNHLFNNDDDFEDDVDCIEEK